MDGCRMCYKKEKNIYCHMNEKNIKDNDYNKYCSKNNTENCPVYQYYFQEYKRLTGKA